MKNSKISWTDATFNGWIGCTKVSPGCEHCYAEALDHRWGNDRWGKGKARGLTSEANWKKPIQWNKEAAVAGVRTKVFCASMSDVFDTEVPDEWRLKLFDLIMNTQNLDWLLLTKRPEEMLKFYKEKMTFGAPTKNIWLGTTVENQEMANKRIPILLSIPGVIHWLSVEPQLGPVDLSKIACSSCEGEPKHMGVLYGSERIDWVISGGESGHGARPFDLKWARNLRDQCKEAGVAFFVKQFGHNWVSDNAKEMVRPAIMNPHSKWDDPQFWPEDLRIQEFPMVGATHGD
jgi:protein gp37